MLITRIKGWEYASIKAGLIALFRNLAAAETT